MKIVTLGALAGIVALGCDGAAPSGAPPPGEQGGIQGCTADVRLLEKPADPAARGPWPVGARTVAVDGLTTEVWYPAEIGSEAGKEPIVYDVRTWLPEPEQSKIPDDDNPWQVSTSYRDLPLDGARGPYPAVIFIHGTAGFRTQSLAHMEHWASRGFIVLAADYPGLYLGDMLALDFSSDLPGDTTRLLAALDAPGGELAFLAGHLDRTRIGMAGHSAGGNGISGFGDAPGVRVLVPLAAGGVEPGSALESTLIMGGLIDAVVDHSQQVSGYEASPARKRLVGISNAGHLFPTDLCWLTNSSGQDIVEIAQEHMVTNSQFASMLFDCPEGQISREAAAAIVNHATAGALEETLHCAAGDPFEGIQERYPDIGEYRQEL